MHVGWSCLVMSNTSVITERHHLYASVTSSVVSCVLLCMTEICCCVELTFWPPGCVYLFNVHHVHFKMTIRLRCTFASGCLLPNVLTNTDTVYKVNTACYPCCAAFLSVKNKNRKKKTSGARAANQRPYMPTLLSSPKN